jgi:hypothetical protein
MINKKILKIGGIIVLVLLVAATLFYVVNILLKPPQPPPLPLTRVGAVTLAEGENDGLSIAISGKYAYVVTETIPAKVVVFDIGMMEN